MIVLDTNILSELMRLRPDTPVIQWMAKQPVSELFTTAITEAEIFYGIELLPHGKKRDRLHEAARITFEEDFSGRILPFDSRAARNFATVAVKRRALGRPVTEADAQIAGIVLSHSAQLATRDVSGFTGCGIAVINPWND